MTYTVGFSPKRAGGKVNEATFQDAQKAWAAVCSLEASDETIRFIKAPWGGEIGKGELEKYAEEEAKKDKQA